MKVQGPSKLTCPECGQSDFFCVEALVTVEATGNGIVAIENPSTEPASWCSCTECEHEATLAEFDGTRKVLVHS